MSTTQDAVAVPQLFAAPQVVQTGTFHYGYLQDSEEWNLHQKAGKFDAEIKFPTPFTTAPTVMIALTGLDSSNGFNTRVVVTSGDVTTLDFEVVVKTWSDSILYGVWGTWIALGS